MRIEENFNGLPGFKSFFLGFRVIKHHFMPDQNIFEILKRQHDMDHIDIFLTIVPYQFIINNFRIPGNSVFENMADGIFLFKRFQEKIADEKCQYIKPNKNRKTEIYIAQGWCISRFSCYFRSRHINKDRKRYAEKEHIKRPENDHKFHNCYFAVRDKVMILFFNLIRGTGYFSYFISYEA